MSAPDGDSPRAGSGYHVSRTMPSGVVVASPKPYAVRVMPLAYGRDLQTWAIPGVAWPYA